ncbi:hypothetical protein B0O99DRAFT_595795 [Bisporella sp. PMI_857]|nr:hypothetical protein B0O99DRAFT_595795 [Bisporella sp. PMI_857]
MSTSLAAGLPSLPTQVDSDIEGFDGQNDPFRSSTSSNHHRFSHFDNQLFALGPATSPEQAKRALEAHLAETEKRIQEASKLGTTLVQQRKELAERLHEVEKQQNEGDLTPELKQKLVDIEKEYNEVGLDSARAFLPKSRVSSAEMAAGSPFVGDAKRSASPSKFESQGTSSPSKLSVPNRKQRNQPSNRVHDIEFATEISTSLLGQVRHLQALLVEKEDALKEVTYQKSRLEAEADGFSQRLRSLDESEQRYKDENWSLETQIHNFLAAAKESADKEKKLTQALDRLQAEKTSAQKELDEIKLSHAKLSEDHAAAVKHYDVELGTVKRNMTMTENERSVLQRKVDDLTGQNQELAKAITYQRGRLEDRDQARGLSDEDFETAPDNVTPEHSPPPSPVKGTPRHSMLESETLKSSLHHAHRMIQNLKGNIHREKTEKLELKRMLQDARDELESRRNDGGLGSAKRNRKTDSKEFKKPLKPGQLGGPRASRSEVFMDDTNWEEDNGQTSPSHAPAGEIAGGFGGANIAESSDNFETANEGTDAFETANERSTETEDFQTGHEDMSGSDDLTETEGPSGNVRNRPTPLALNKPGNRNSWQSTASTSGDEYSYEEVKTPTAQPQRLRLKVNRGASRRLRIASEEPQFQEGSPASFANSSQNGTPQAGQSLFAELGNISDEDESLQGTPSRSTFLSQSVTPGSRPSTAKGTPAPVSILPPSVPKLPMVDSGMMTEAWEPEPPTPQTAVPTLPEVVAISEPIPPPIPKVPMVDSGMVTDPWEQEPAHSKHDMPVTGEAVLGGAAISEAAHLLHEHMPSKAPPTTADAASQWYDADADNFLKVDAPESSRPISTSTYSDRSSQYDPVLMDEKLAKFPSPPSSRAHTPLASLATLETKAVPLSISTIYSEYVEPESPVLPATPKQPPAPSPKLAPIVIPSPLVFSSIQSIDTEPIETPPPRSPSEHAVILPRDDAESALQEKEPETPKPTIIGAVFGGWNKKGPSTPIIAEDETRQSPSDSPLTETPESQRPFKELSHNAIQRSPSPKKPRIETVDESSQTALTAEQIDEMLNSRRQAKILAEDSSRAPVSPVRSIAGVSHGLKGRKSQESIGSIGRAKSKMVDPDLVHDIVPIKRPTSAGSTRKNSISSIHPPLPTDHKQVIAAAAQRTGSSNGDPGSMGPPPLPASAFRSNPSFRPRTPSNQVPLSPIATSTTPRGLHAFNRTGELQSPTSTARSRRSSVTSFASEVDTRFNLRPGMLPDGIEPGTDPRMINAITQTMIGEYLWKYTRKAGRGSMSENRHRRYFWVHPYTRTLYWSDRDPSQAGRAELKAKSVPIEAVRVVTDDNPMPPGLHRKSLVIVTPGRAVKFTATTGQRHETWFNALSYLLLRTADAEASEVATGALTHEDVNEFNPGFGSKTRQGPVSLSSYNSRTTRNDSPTRASAGIAPQPQLAQSKSTSSRPSMGTFSRLSNMWQSGKDGRLSSFSSRHGRQSIGGDNSIYEASEVHDSAEDLREMIEKQDRESDKLENVRACCDGKHDVGHLHTHSIKGRTPSTTIGAASGSQRPEHQKQKSRNSLMRRHD